MKIRVNPGMWNTYLMHTDPCALDWPEISEGGCIILFGGTYNIQLLDINTIAYLE